MADTTTAVSPLRRRMIDDMMLRNLSPATQRSYLHAVTKFNRHFGRSPDRLGLEDVRAFQVYLVSQGISWPSLNQTVCALRFFYGVTLNRGEIPERIAYARTPRKLPAILSPDEVVGLSRRAAVERFDVGTASAIRWVREWQETGSARAKPQGGVQGRSRPIRTTVPPTWDCQEFRVRRGG